MSMEDRLRAAMRAEANNMEPNEYDSLDSIRSRGRAARNRRRAVLGGGLTVLVLIAALLIVPRLGDDDETLGVADDPTTTTDGGATTTTEATTTTSTTIPFGSNPQMLWPGPDHERFDDPVEAARSFVEEYIGFANPPLSEFHEGEPGAGEVEVYATGEGGQALDRAASTIFVRAFEGGDWFVTGAHSDEVVIETPGPLDVVTSPVVVDGRGRGFEGNIVLQIREAFATEPLVQETTIGGAFEELMPFHAEVPLFGIEPATPSGALVAMSSTGLEDAVIGFTVIPIRFEAATTELTVFFHDSNQTQLQPVQRSVPRTTGVLRASLEALLAGPSSDEQAAGLTSLFSAESAGNLDDVRIDDGVAVVQLGGGIADAIYAGSSAAATSVVEQLNATVFQFPTVQSVRYELGGSCEDFGDWVQPYGTCEFDKP